MKSPSTYSVLHGGAGSGTQLSPIINLLPETMRRSASMTTLTAFISVFIFVSFCLYSTRGPIYVSDLFNPLVRHGGSLVHAIQDELPDRYPNDSVPEYSYVDSVSILFPDWEVLVIVTDATPVTTNENFICWYPNGETSPARFAAVLPSTNQSKFKCEFPKRNRRSRPYLSPEIRRSSHRGSSPASAAETNKELMKWNFLAYESFSTEDDVVLFVKGVNNRQGVNRSPQDFKCLFRHVNGSTAVGTEVTSSAQELFRCRHPDLTAFRHDGAQDDETVPFKVKVSLEIPQESAVVPTVAYYTPWRRMLNQERKSQMCAATMIYNAAKFLREWVMYHSTIGVDRFILYDNDSDDGLSAAVEELIKEGYNVETVTWVWPKTQEAGFSHAALYANHSCTWMMYVDVDEFVFSPSWASSSNPSDHMLMTLIPEESTVGQVSIRCNEFGPSNQRSHPQQGVTQGYTCRRKSANRHKSIVLIDAIEDSLLNAIHHFRLKRGYRSKQLSLQTGVVNHYKYQAWSEFKVKFRRRVSTYVVDWMRSLNPMSKDRTPGLGFDPVEPDGWENRFCEVRDDQLKVMTQKWFGNQTGSGHGMAWQR
ncbi:hypothetical protein K2173_027714 [Erythroxylum novogranatense]|uniref:Glycosyltransferase family 92 protein n=1 Tax=Erythroxylum novogranatense TaxID=1862640 RepID=A0AAV8TZR8_9ROSI|nr:hypothetical protein K2173_027714 [Erythroxylum novogranatense]